MSQTEERTGEVRSGPGEAGLVYQIEGTESLLIPSALGPDIVERETPGPPTVPSPLCLTGTTWESPRDDRL